MYDVIVIGGGPAGVTAALRARELGASVALVEGARLGGTGTHDGCAPTRVLVEAARLLRAAQRFDEYGLVGEPPQIDFPKLLAHARQMTKRLGEKKQLEQHLVRSGVRLFLDAGYARFSDLNTVTLEDGTDLQGGSFVICAGGRARRPDFPGSDLALTHSDIWFMKALPPSMAIGGGAATGCQLASIFAQFGSRVTILEQSVRLLEVEDSIISEAMAQTFLQRGIELVFGVESLDRIEKTSGRLRLYYRQHGILHHLEVDAVVLALGWSSNADHLNVDVAGVQTDNGYIVVDQYLRTTAPHIYAAGDINGRMMLVQSASYEGRIAAENAVRGAGQRTMHTIVPHGAFTNPEYASVGLTEEEARNVEQDPLIAVVPYADLDRAVIDDHADGYCKLIVSQSTHRILGAHIVGEQALEAIHLVAAGMVADMWVEHLAELELAYPTYSSVVGLAARHLVRSLGMTPMAATWQALSGPLIAEPKRPADPRHA
ncbi:MAG: dihydrolipoyl dehydrogenase family protein [Anaerolineae bacterium]